MQSIRQLDNSLPEGLSNGESDNNIGYVTSELGEVYDAANSAKQATDPSSVQKKNAPAEGVSSSVGSNRLLSTTIALGMSMVALELLL